MTRSPVHISSWVFTTLTFSVVGLTPLCAGGAQEAGGAIRTDSAVHAAPGDDGIKLQRLIEGLSAWKLRRPENNGRWPRPSCHKSRRSPTRDSSSDINACR